ncbi:hypothetical protein [Falsirhodobacter deserti]|uniref:hypothetical protein n=1 Tax=Falsirhodobacter deserti TaxID=1365611 RepID=UPI000FE3E1B4|nr:hypothetical protein [Falsirhodobacter deserti]
MVQAEDHPKSYNLRRTLEVRPLNGEMIKPAELIDIQGATGLSLAARRLYNRLLANAFGPDMGFEGRDFSIPLSELRGTHAGNECIDPAESAQVMPLI